MQPMKHGYTNDVAGDGTQVVKAYQGPDAKRRFAHEHRVLTGLQGLLPVPPVHGATGEVLTLGFLPGAHGQDLMDAGHAVAVLDACGRLLRSVHQAPTGTLALGEPAEGQVLVHGDFGPNNILLDPASFEVTALLDWEFAHLGEPIEDLAWCEWIVRMHHPQHVGALGSFFDAYGGAVPAWSARQAYMVGRCRSLEEFCERWEPGGGGVRQWRERAAVAANWRE